MRSLGPVRCCYTLLVKEWNPSSCKLAFRLFAKVGRTIVRNCSNTVTNRVWNSILALLIWLSCCCFAAGWLCSLKGLRRYPTKRLILAQNQPSWWIWQNLRKKLGSQDYSCDFFYSKTFGKFKSSSRDIFKGFSIWSFKSLAPVHFRP